MNKLKNLLLVLFAPAFVLLVSWILSTYNEFVWNLIVFFTFCVMGFNIFLYIRSPQTLSSATVGFMLSGSLYAFLATGTCGEYEEIFKLLAATLFAFTTFFICVPNIVKPTKKQKP